MARRLAVWIAALMLAAPAAAQQDAPPPAVTVATPVQADVVDRAEFTGRFAAISEVTLQANVTGYLTEVLFVDGQVVQAGDPLFVIDPRPFDAAVASARAQVESARATARLAKLDLDRAEQLVRDAVVSQQALDQARATYDSATAGVAAAEAALRAAELDRGFAQIAAPIGGRMSAAQIDAGNLVTAGSSVLTSIVSVDPINFYFDISESDYLAYDAAFGSSLQGAAAEGSLVVGVRLLDEKGFAREGVVDFVDNTFDATTGTIRVRAVFPNPDDTLVPGLFGRLEMPASRPYAALLVPDSAIMADQANRIVLVVDEEDTVAPHTVTLGPLYRGMRVITSGLEADQRIIVEGLLRVRPGQKVTPQETTLVLNDGEG